MKQKVQFGAALTLLAPALAAGQATIQGIGDLPGGPIGSGASGVSGDGLVVVGSSATDYPDWPYEGGEAIRWSNAEGISGLGYKAPPGYGVGGTDARADGTVIVGIGPHPESGKVQAFRWTEVDGGIWLNADGRYSNPYAVSGDGSVVVGRCGDEGFRWTSAHGMQFLGNLGGGGQTWGAAVSADGSVIVGESPSPQGYQAFRWTQAEGMIGLGDLPGGDTYSTAWAVSADGKTIMGFSASGNGMELYRWTQAGGMVGLGLAPPGEYWSIPCYASADGAVVVGTLWESYPFIWTEADGAHPLRDVLIERGATDAADWTLNWANGISDDGRVIVGSGTNPDGQGEGWAATLPPACYADLNADYTLDLFDFLTFLNLFNTANPAADCDASGSLDLFDFLCFTNAFNAGC